MSDSANTQNVPDAVDQPHPNAIDESAWKGVKKELEEILDRLQAISDAQTQLMDVINVFNRLVGHVETLSDWRVELGLLGEQNLEMKKHSVSILDQSYTEVDQAISACMSIFDNVVKNVKKDANKICKTDNKVKRDKRVTEALKNLDTHMLAVTAPIFDLPTSNVFCEVVIRRFVPPFDRAKSVMSAKIKEAH
ncbi:hypothetical protein QM012_009395 [Aureobasidium pullulans]|uniref:Fungal N-terminal domain-containing protein n=1 Tax=Aureobasidium pullulans TaxID=5580 RepID=A0ABR0TH99_AURPU